MHSYHQVLLIRDGVTLLVDQEQKQPLFGNMASFIPAFLPHRSVVRGNGASYKSIYLSPDYFLPTVKGIIIFRISPLTRALFERIDLSGRDALSRNLNRDCLELFLRVLPEDLACPADLARLPEPSTQLAGKIVEFIEGNYSRKLSLSDFAAALPYSGRHLARLFKNDLQITIMEYLRRYRMLLASMALCDPEVAATDIAFECGYESLSSFYRDFHQTFGLTPKHFRKNMEDGL